MDKNLTVEETLRYVEGRMAFIRHWGNASSAAFERMQGPDEEALSGLGDACDDVFAAVRAMRRVMPIETLSKPAFHPERPEPLPVPVRVAALEMPARRGKRTRSRRGR